MVTKEPVRINISILLLVSIISWSWNKKKKGMPVFSIKALPNLINKIAQVPKALKPSNYVPFESTLDSCSRAHPIPFEAGAKRVRVCTPCLPAWLTCMAMSFGFICSSFSAGTWVLSGLLFVSPFVNSMKNKLESNYSDILINPSKPSTTC